MDKHSTTLSLWSRDSNDTPRSAGVAGGRLGTLQAELLSPAERTGRRSRCKDLKARRDAPLSHAPSLPPGPTSGLSLAAGSLSRISLLPGTRAPELPPEALPFPSLCPCPAPPGGSWPISRTGRCVPRIQPFPSRFRWSVWGEETGLEGNLGSEPRGCLGLCPNVILAEEPSKGIWVGDSTADRSQRPAPSLSSVPQP